MIEVVRTGDWSLGGERRSIEIASIVGTSAGGINTLLAALAWSVNPESEGGFTNRIDDNIFRDVWLTPDVNRLLPPNANSPQYLPDDALLSRKDLVEVARELRKKWRRPGTFRPGCRLPLGVTVTRVRPETMLVSGVEVNNQRFYIPFEMRTRADGSVKFFFDPNDYPSLTDPAMILMPWSSDDSPFSISDQQVEDSILTTSAFPVGFGRKRLQYCRQKAFYTDDDSATTPSMEAADANEKELVCPDGYELAEAEFADGGLFDNLPIGLARLLSESSTLHKKEPLPIKYIYLDPNRERYETPVSEDKRACEGENPPAACRELTFDLASEAVVLGGAIGTARKYELYREMTSENWRLNLSQLSHKIADILDANKLDVQCHSDLSYFDRQLGCSDRLRYTGRLLELAHGYHVTPIKAPLSAQALLQESIATTCRPPSAEAEQGFASECIIDTPRLRKQLANVLADLSEEVVPEDENLKKDIRRSALSIDSDRSIHVTSRGSPITGF
ncbi:MAG: patatin-like phospholipase family protein, partial [Planctomycetales bacterium]